MQWFKRISHLNGLNARVDVNCKRKDARTDGRTDGRTENHKPISHLAEAGATETVIVTLIFKV